MRRVLDDGHVCLSLGPELDLPVPGLYLEIDRIELPVAMVVLVTPELGVASTIPPMARTPTSAASSPNINRLGRFAPLMAVAMDDRSETWCLSFLAR